MKVPRLACLAGALLLACGVAPSETIYSNFDAAGPDGSGGGYLLGSVGHPGPHSGFYGVAVAFVPAEDYLLDSIRIPITGLTNTPNNQFTIELRDGTAEPGQILESYSQTFSGFVVLHLRSGLRPLLQAGKRYWVVVITTAGGGEWGWGGIVHPPGTVFVRSTQFQAWQPMSAASSSLPGLLVSGTPASGTPVTPVQPATVGIFPHVAAGGGWQTTFILVNTGTAPSPVHLSFYDDDGNAQFRSLVLSQSGGSINASSLAETVPGNASLLVTDRDIGVLRQGSAQLATTGSIGAFAIIRSTSSGEEAGLPLETRSARSYLLAFDESGETRTAIALTNASASPVSIPITIRYDSGALADTAAIPLPPRGHASFLLAGAYPRARDSRGTVQFDAPTGAVIGVFGLRLAPAAAGQGPSLTAIPVLAK